MGGRVPPLPIQIGTLVVVDHPHYHTIYTLDVAMLARRPKRPQGRRAVRCARFSPVYSENGPIGQKASTWLCRKLMLLPHELFLPVPVRVTSSFRSTDIPYSSRHSHFGRPECSGTFVNSVN